MIDNLVRALTANRWHKKSPLPKQCAYQKNILTLYQKGNAMDSVMQQFSDWLKSIIKETLNKLLEIERDDGFPELMDMKTTYKIFRYFI